MNKKIYTVIYLLLLAAFFCFFTIFIFYSDAGELIFHIPDDASYYAKIALNYSNGFGISFDGINQTNGFQPLWQYFVIFIAAVYKSSPENIFRLILFIQLILISLSAFVIFKLVSRFFNARTALGSGAVFLLFVFPLCLNGMESALSVLVLSFLFKSICNTGYLINFNLKNDILISAICGLLILTRLDMILFVITLMIYFFINSISNNNAKTIYIKKILVLIIFVSAILLPYLINNLIVFGNIIPISGFLKTGIPDTSLSDKLIELFRYRETYFVLSAFLFFISYVYFFRNRENITGKDFSELIFIFSVSCILHFIFLLFFVNWVIFYWYFIPFAVFFSLVIAFPLYYLQRLKRFGFGNIIYFSFLIIILFYWKSKIINNFDRQDEYLRNNWNLESYKASLWIKDNTDKKAVFAMKDAGHFGFFGEREVINLDGLVNDFKYQEVLRSKRLNEYLKENKVNYLVQHALWNRPDVTEGNYDSLELTYTSHRYSVQSDPVVVYKKNEIYRSEPYFDGNNRVSFIIWKLN